MSNKLKTMGITEEAAVVPKIDLLASSDVGQCMCFNKTRLGVAGQLFLPLGQLKSYYNL